jgi:hypothetical protein
VTSPAQDAVRLHQVSQDKIRVSATNRVVVLARLAGNQFLDSLKGFQKRALVAMGLNITNVPLILKIWEKMFCFWVDFFMGHFTGYFEGASTFLTPKLSLAALWKI